MTHAVIPLLALAISTRSGEFAGLASGLLALAGVWLRWRGQSHVADIEEAVKNGKMSAAAGQRRMRFVERRAVLMIFGGIGLMAVCVGSLLL